MKKLFFIFALAYSITCSAQSVQLNGKNFSATQEVSVKNDTKTDYTWTDSKGQKYVIYITKRGAAYYIATSKKTGKEYKRYLPKEVAEKINKQ